jgi:DNA-binding PadR family transcriptional regulator
VTLENNGIKRFLPLKPLDFQVLTVLGHRELHGYGVVHAAKEQFPDQPALELGSLYRIIGRMLDHKLIREVRPPATRPDDRKVRRYYTITDLGLHVVRAEAARMRSLLAAPVSRELEA